MTNDKKRKLEKKGWKVGSAGDFLGLGAEETAFIELKVRQVKELRHPNTEVRDQAD
jgi:hypothetical protein